MKSLKELRKDKTANSGTFSMVMMGAVVLIILAVVLELGPLIGYQTATAVTIPASTSATGTFTFSGNVSNGELVNITNGGAVYRFEFNTSGNPNTASVLTANAIRVNVSDIGGWNASIQASGNLTAAINANASTSALVTAANTTNVTTLTAATGGTGANSISLADNAANVASSGMAGGIDGNSWNSGDNTAITNGSELWAQNTPMISVTTIAIFAGLIIAVLLTIVGRRGGGQGSANI